MTYLAVGTKHISVLYIGLPDTYRSTAKVGHLTLYGQYSNTVIGTLAVDGRTV